MNNYDFFFFNANENMMNDVRCKSHHGNILLGLEQCMCAKKGIFQNIVIYFVCMYACMYVLLSLYIILYHPYIITPFCHIKISVVSVDSDAVQMLQQRPIKQGKEHLT